MPRLRATNPLFREWWLKHGWAHIMVAQLEDPEDQIKTLAEGVFLAGVDAGMEIAKEDWNATTA